MRQNATSHNLAQSGFTLIELLVVVAIIAALASLLLPGLIRVKQKVQGIQCMNHQRQLTLAWLVYAHDHDDWFCDAVSWVGAGFLDFNPANPSNWDVSADIQKSPLWVYCWKIRGDFQVPGRQIDSPSHFRAFQRADRAACAQHVHEHVVRRSFGST